MSLIVFDLEWNIGYQPRTFMYHGVEQTLRGEIIQIGAVKVDRTGQVLDTFSIDLKPRIFRKLQHHIAKVTGFTQKQLDAGVPIKEGLARFVDWCGPDASFGEWGMDDVPVLKQNLFLCGMDESWPTVWYDLQQVFLAEHPRGEGEGMTLESVITRLGIPMERPFHDALSDALYTVDVCQRLDLEKGLAQYPTEEEQLIQSACPEGPEYKKVECFYGYLEKEAWREDEELHTLTCPWCGGSLETENAPKLHEAEEDRELWMRRGNNSYYGLCHCADCRKDVFVRYKLSRRDGLRWAVARVMEAPTAESREKWVKQKKRMAERLQKKTQEKVTAAAEK